MSREFFWIRCLDVPVSAMGLLKGVIEDAFGSIIKDCTPYKYPLSPDLRDVRFDLTLSAKLRYKERLVVDLWEFGRMDIKVACATTPWCSVCRKYFHKDSDESCPKNKSKSTKDPEDKEGTEGGKKDKGDDGNGGDKERDKGKVDGEKKPDEEDKNGTEKEKSRDDEKSDDKGREKRKGKETSVDGSGRKKQGKQTRKVKPKAKASWRRKGKDKQMREEREPVVFAGKPKRINDQTEGEVMGVSLTALGGPSNSEIISIEKIGDHLISDLQDDNEKLEMIGHSDETSDPEAEEEFEFAVAGLFEAGLIQFDIQKDADKGRRESCETVKLPEGLSALEVTDWLTRREALDYLSSEVFQNQVSVGGLLLGTPGIEQGTTERVTARIQGWVKHYKLSTFGRALVLSVAAFSILWFPLSICLLGQEAYTTIRTTAARYLWKPGAEEGEGYIAKAAWDTVRFPREEGGMGLQDPHLQNLALLAKWVIKALFEYPTKLWVRLA
ncbi:hypothetical protein CBR_g37564 [Chara braunii]|uniref:DUF4283 domain-containing protein n=1 Tax=Chara braunii TaxID=69332 RepID=A0A388LNG7_CHABU|nr:hypothetical protein CBR_g37564 [Chara braunii]|eukprot:GBG83763.1 hypothetical protein CBR_g37564 [Chara braunii]